MLQPSSSDLQLAILALLASTMTLVSTLVSTPVIECIDTYLAMTSWLSSTTGYPISDYLAMRLAIGEHWLCMAL